MNETARLLISWPCVQDRIGDSPELSKYLEQLVRESRFQQTDETTWAYHKVVSFLEDGWHDAQRYGRLREDTVSLDDFGHAMNRLVGGHRYEEADATEQGVSWLGAGSWPTQADVAAFFYFVAWEPPAPVTT